MVVPELLAKEIGCRASNASMSRWVMLLQSRWLGPRQSPRGMADKNGSVTGMYPCSGPTHSTMPREFSATREESCALHLGVIALSDTYPLRCVDETPERRGGGL